MGQQKRLATYERTDSMLITAVLRPVAVRYELLHVVDGGTAIRAHASAIAQHSLDKLAIQSVPSGNRSPVLEGSRT